MPERVNEIQLLMCIVYYDPLNLINGKDFCANIIFFSFYLSSFEKSPSRFCSYFFQRQWKGEGGLRERENFI